MPVKKIEFTNFKGQSGTHELFQQTKVEGKNGSGKTLIKDVLAFGFCGVDSFGTRNPTHLISNDQNDLKVFIDTGKAVFSRTLTRKGSSTIKLEMSGIASTYNQSQLEDKIGKTDTFLSVLIPGYFFSLSEAKRQDVLSEILPKVDRLALIKEASGIELDEEEQKKYGVNRRFDLVATSVSTDRRTFEAAINQKKGSVEVYKKMIKPEPLAPNPYTSQISILENLKQSNEKYTEQLNALKSAESHNAKLEDANTAINKRLSDIETELDFNKNQLQDLELFRVEQSDEEFKKEIAAIESDMMEEPKEPSSVNIVMQDNCPTCGQSVSERHRDSVRAQNEKITQEYITKLEQVRSFNKAINDLTSKMKLDRQVAVKKYEEVVNFNRDIKSKMQSLENEKAATKLQEKIELPEVMVKPEEYDLKKHLQLKEDSKKYEQSIGEYNGKLKAYNEGQDEMKKFEEELLDNVKVFQRLSKLEDTLKVLPSMELKRQAGLFDTESLKFNGEIVLVNGIPYNMLSTGEKMAVNLYFSRRISELWHRSHKIIFLDDADLLSTETYEKVSLKLPEQNDIQQIMAYVTDDPEVKISGN